METIRVIDKARYSLQRLGFLKYITWQCSKLGTSNIFTIGKDLINTVSRKISVPSNDDIITYLKHRINYKKAKTVEKNNEKIVIELQDAYLADNRLPARTGKLLSDEWGEYPRFAISLGLIRKTSYSLLGKGQLLIEVTDKDELIAFKKYRYEDNPLLINDKQKLLFLFLLLLHDGDVIKPLYKKVLEIKEFSSRSLGDYLSDIYLQIAKESRQKVRSGDDIEKIQRLINKANVLERWKGKPDTGSRTARNKAIVVRIEPYVDLGIIEKKDPFAFKYRISDAGYVFFSEFVKANDIKYFLYNSFFETCNKAFNYETKKNLSDPKLIPLFLESYIILKSPLGYASIEDVILLTVIKAIVERKIYFEIQDGINILTNLQKQNPDSVRFNIDRLGNLTYVKFENEFISLINKVS